jgi:hypothetical protein
VPIVLALHKRHERMGRKMETDRTRPASPTVPECAYCAILTGNRVCKIVNDSQV